jgi:hypothetical protein
VPVGEPVAAEPIVEPSFVVAEEAEVPEEAVVVETTAEPVAVVEPGGAVEAVTEAPVTSDSNVVASDDAPEAALTNAAPAEAPEAQAMEEHTGDAADDAPETYVEVLPRTTPTPEESGRAEALRNLRMRRNARFSPDQS